MARTLWWEFFAGAGLFGLILGVATLNVGVVLVSVVILAVCLWHFERTA